jgi:hypothetical protein
VMRRAALSLVSATLAFLVLPALPSSAKGFSVARFTGPGLPARGVNIDGETGNLFDLGLYAPRSAKLATLGAVGLSKRELGPAYEGWFRVDWARRFLLHQVVYPYAPGGAWAYTPPGQLIETQRLAAGWFHAPPRLLRLLVSFGFPKTAPDTTHAGPAASDASKGVAAQPPPMHESWPAWAWILIAFGVGGALLLVATRQRRRVTA